MEDKTRTPEEQVEQRPAMRRRTFLKRVGLLAGVGVAGGGYAVLESGWLRIEQKKVSIPGLPKGFVGTKVVVISDIHHGPFVSLGYVERLVREVNALQPDIIAIPGDFVYKSPKYIAPCFRALRHLKAKMGVYVVCGNHDHWESTEESMRAIKGSGLGDLNNEGVWLKKGNQRLRLAGVDDLWEGKQDLKRAMGDAKEHDVAILLSHNPDYAESLKDPRVKLVLSGHTHGGQVVIPWVGPPIVPSRYGKKYAAGLVAAPHTQVFVSRGAGVIGLPVRFNCRPEINVLVLS
ncbi:MAG: metallophosphoesterase [Deltaproteobacteria bacterium]|nr:metallophosphoesterase [Deltaproteobacteria bacterium]MBU47894.1 metallophosphoesterase [Deltaproteobacteria bacterium]